MRLGAAGIVFGLLTGCVSTAKTFNVEGWTKLDYSVIYLVRPKEDPLAQVDNATQRFEALGYKVIPVAHGQPPEGGEGTGFVVTADGHVLTCDHVLLEAAAARIWVGETRYEAEVVARDKDRDLALLRITDKLSAPLTPASFRRGDVTLGEQVFAMGYPISNLLGKSLHITQGLISAMSGLSGDAKQVQISAGIQPGNSGGPVFDSNGRVTSIVQQTINPWAVAQKTGGALPQNVNFGIKGSVALDFLKEKAPKVHERLTFDATTTLAGAQPAVVRIRSGLVSKELEAARKMVVFLHYESFFDMWYRFRYYVLSFFDFESEKLLFRSGQLGDNIISNHTVVIEDTFKEIERTIGRAPAPAPAP
jgi:hypothetical protein